MKSTAIGGFTGLIATIAFTLAPAAPAQQTAPAEGNPAVAPAAQNASSGNTSTLLTGHPFSATKFARRVRILADGKEQFIRNELYPSLLARDADGRLMMQVHNLAPECNHLDQLVPPVCPHWWYIVIDPVAHTVTHFGGGEIAHHGSVTFPLTEARMDEAARVTGDLPKLLPDFTDEDGKVTRADLGTRTIEGVAAHGLRWTLLYEVNRDGKAVQRTRIHEVWTSEEMKLVVRVVDGNPRGVETVWGLEKISLKPDPALFEPPADYRRQRNNRSSDGGYDDFQELDTWFEGPSGQ